MAHVPTLDPARFDEDVLAADRPVLVDFYADWCPPCRAMAPVLDELAVSLGDQARIVKVDVDKAPELAQRYNVRSIPTMILFHGGEAVDTQVGAVPGPVLAGKLAAVGATA